MGKILLIRHGESVANSEKRFTRHDDEPLTETGRAQAMAAGLHIASQFEPSALLSSRFARARETAAIIGLHVNLPVAILPDIHERDFGVLKGEPYSRFDEMIAVDPAYDPATHWCWAPTGGESRADLQRRVLPVLEQVAEAHADSDVLVVCHGVVIQSVWAHWHGNWDTAPVPRNCGIVLLERAAAKVRPPELLHY